MFGKIGESSYTKTVRVLLRGIQDNTKLEDSLYEHAAAYFKHALPNKDKLADLNTALAHAQTRQNQAPPKDLPRAKDATKNAKRALKAEQDRQRLARNSRYQHAYNLLQQIIQHSEGTDWQDTQANSAKLLGTVFLLSPAEGLKLQSLHKRLKPLYKAVLSVRLLDKLLADGHSVHPYVDSQYSEATRFPEQTNELSPFQQQIVIPVLLAAVFQDIGLMHPESQKILVGKDGTLDEFRLLEQEDRLRLLKLNLQHTLDYIINGLGVAPYIGNSKAEREEFVRQQRKQLAFTLDLLKDAFKIQQGVGNILKTPQIYCSVVLSTKRNYQKEDLPKAALLLEKVAESGSISKASAAALTSITGHFPQGFGLVYIPVDDRGQQQDRYEYAIVNGLNPEDPQVPYCRMVTRNLTFNSFGHNARIPQQRNLYYPQARKKLSKLSTQRLKEIMTALYSNYNDDIKLELLPRFWRPYTFFCYQAYQNLWNKTDTKRS